MNNFLIRQLQLFLYFLFFPLIHLILWYLLFLKNIMCNHWFHYFHQLLKQLHYILLANFLQVRHIVIVINFGYLTFHSIHQFESLSLNLTSLMMCFVLIPSFLQILVRQILCLDLLVDMFYLHFVYIYLSLNYTHIE